MLLCAFHTLSYAFKRQKYANTQKRKTSPPPPPTPHPVNYTIVRLSRCAAGKNKCSELQCGKNVECRCPIRLVEYICLLLMNWLTAPRLKALIPPPAAAPATPPPMPTDEDDEED